MRPNDNDKADHKESRPADVAAGLKPNSTPHSETGSGNPAPRHIHRPLDMANFRLAIKQYRLGVVATVIAVLALIAAVSPDFFPHYGSLLRRLVEGPRKDQVRIPHVDPTKFTVLVAQLDHDDGNGAQEAIVIALEDTAGIVVDRLNAAIPAGKTSEVEAGHLLARKYLKDSGAKLLIWGTFLVVDGRETINLYLTPLQTVDVPDTARLYELVPDLVIQPSFLGDLLQAIQLAVVDYVTTGHNTEPCSNTAQQLAILIDDVRQRVDGDKAKSWSPTTRISVRLSLAAALRTLGAITGSPEPDTDAISVCRTAMAEAKPHSEAWARAQLQLGMSYESLAAWGTPAERVRNPKEALESFRAALGVLGKGDIRTAVLLMIGTSLIQSVAAENPPNERMIQEAVATFRDALRSLDRDREPLLWGQARGLLGLGLLASALRPGDHRIVLAEAQSAFMESLELTRERSPLTWASTQTLSGLTSIALSNSDSPNAADHLRDAVGAFNQSLTVETSSCTPLPWAETQQQLGNALTLLGQGENDVQDFRKAEDAYRAELKIHTNGEFPSQWASAQTGLSRVLSLRGDREHDPVLVCQALYRAMLCAGINKYCMQSGLQDVVLAYNTLGCEFDRHDREDCRSRLEEEVHFEGDWKGLLSNLSKPGPYDSGKPCTRSNK